jgi:hypothetical protein
MGFFKATATLELSTGSIECYERIRMDYGVYICWKKEEVVG